MFHLVMVPFTRTVYLLAVTSVFAFQVFVSGAGNVYRRLAFINPPLTSRDIFLKRTIHLRPVYVGCSAVIRRRTPCMKSYDSSNMNDGEEGGYSDCITTPMSKLPRMISYGLRSRSSPATRKALGSASRSHTTVYVCEQCGAEHVQWLGRCPTCQEWNTIKRLRVPRGKGEDENSIFASQSRSRLAAVATAVAAVSEKNSSDSITAAKWANWTPAVDNLGPAVVMRLTDIPMEESEARLSLPGTELNRVLGGGFVPGGCVMIGGDPGVGKSTLLLQVAGCVTSQPPRSLLRVSAQHENNRSRLQGGYEQDDSPVSGSGTQVQYISGEESTSQIASRARRLGINTPNLQLLSEIDVNFICEAIVGASPRPALVVVDSVQTLRAPELGGAPGSITQVRECAARLVNVAKACGIALVLVGHVTKAGDIAGPRTVEHMVDTVLFLEGDSMGAYRILRSVKNRFGSSNEVGVFEMLEHGLEEVVNPSALFVSDVSSFSNKDSGQVGSAPPPLPDGSAVLVTMEGSRPLLCEVQALVTKHSALQLPKRACDGIPAQRLLLLLAVIQRRLGYTTRTREVYINVIGGLSISEKASDLGVAMAIISSFCGIPVASGVAFIGEIGLSGEVRMVQQINRRISEAQKFGFTRVVVPKAPLKKREDKAADRKSRSLHKGNIEVVEVRTLVEAVNQGLERLPPPPPKTNTRREHYQSRRKPRIGTHFRGENAGGRMQDPLKVRNCTSNCTISLTRGG